MGYLSRSVTNLPSHLPSCQTLVYSSGQWPDYPKNYPENVDYRRAVENLDTEMLKEIVEIKYYYGEFRIEALKILEERSRVTQSLVEKP